MSKRITLKDNEVIMTKSDLEDFIWMSYRYCVGRKTGAAYCHAATIMKYVDNLSPERQMHIVDDLRRDISTMSLHCKDNIYTDGYCEAGDAISILIKYMIEHKITMKETQQFHNNRIDINTRTGEIILSLLPEEKKDKFLEHSYRYLYQELEDFIPWIKLCNYLDKACHRILILESEEVECMPYPSLDISGIPEIKWVPVNMFKANPERGTYIAPAYIKFKE